MSLISVVVVLIVVGVILWLVNTYIPMDAKIKNILNIVVLGRPCSLKTFLAILSSPRDFSCKIFSAWELK